MTPRALVALFVTMAACGGGHEEAFFPADYAATYTEVRNCRFSLEHDLVRVRVLASPEAVVPYTVQGDPFPTGSIVLKEEYAEADMTCAGPLMGITAMQKLAVGSSADTLDWQWQATDGSHEVVDKDLGRCVRCHQMCSIYDQTCTEP